MSDIVPSTEVTRFPRLQFSCEHFAGYLTALLSKIRQDAVCDAIFTGITQHPVIALQATNQQQLTGLQIPFVAPAYLEFHPFIPTELLIAQVNDKNNADPKLDNGWDEFTTAWASYKNCQRKIYGTIISTLRVGTSMYYARSVPFGVGTLLLRVIRDDNMQMTTRALFALFASLFTLKIKSGESFESFRARGGHGAQIRRAGREGRTPSQRTAAWTAVWRGSLRARVPTVGAREKDTTSLHELSVQNAADCNSGGAPAAARARPAGPRPLPARAPAPPRPHRAAAAARLCPWVVSDSHFRKTATEYDRKPGIKWLGCAAK